MAELATVARPYAEAAFSVAESGDLNAWSAALSELAQVASVPELISMASNPKVSRAEVGAVLQQSVRATLTPEMQNFLTMLVDNHRLALLPEIDAQFEILKNEREGSADAFIVSAFPLDGAPLQELVAALEKKFGRRLKPTVTVDSALIGGVRVTVGDEVLDGSVRARLNQMQTALAA